MEVSTIFLACCYYLPGTKKSHKNLIGILCLEESTSSSYAWKKAHPPARGNDTWYTIQLSSAELATGQTDLHCYDAMTIRWSHQNLCFKTRHRLVTCWKEANTVKPKYQLMAILYCIGRTIFRSYVDKHLYNFFLKLNPLHHANWMNGFTIIRQLKLGDLPRTPNCVCWLVSDLLVRLNSRFFLPGPGDKFSLVFEQV